MRLFYLVGMIKKISLIKLSIYLMVFGFSIYSTFAYCFNVSTVIDLETYQGTTIENIIQNFDKLKRQYIDIKRMQYEDYSAFSKRKTKLRNAFDSHTSKRYKVVIRPDIFLDWEQGVLKASFSFPINTLRKRTGETKKINIFVNESDSLIQEMNQFKDNLLVKLTMSISDQRVFQIYEMDLLYRNKVYYSENIGK